MAYVQQQKQQGFKAGIEALSKGRGHGIAAATMGVTVALEEVRKHGYLSRDHMRGMTNAEKVSYVDLAGRELGVTKWTVDA